MCTLTWFSTERGYQLFFNRDERRTRLPGVEPALRRQGSTRYLAPLDGDHGGSWIAVSEHGLSTCLLNGFVSTGEPPAVRDVGLVSRGCLIGELIESPSAAAAIAQLEQLDLERFQPFMLAIFEPDRQAALARWDGTALDLGAALPQDQPLVSSSFYTEEVRASRCSVLSDVLSRHEGEPAERHLAYHESHQPSRGPYSPCMHRPDARTVSFAHIVVGPQRASIRYVADSPCRGRPTGAGIALPRR